MYIVIDGSAYIAKRNLIGFVSLLAFIGVVIIGVVILYFFVLKINKQNRQYKEQMVKQSNLVNLGQAARTLTHEIKNPLSAITIQLALLKRQIKDPEYLEELALIESESQRLISLTNRVSDFLKNPEGQPEQIDLIDLINQLIPLFAYPVKLLETSEKQAYILFDPDRLRSVIENIIKNGIESCEGRDPQVEVEVVLGRNGIYHVYVRDRGDGIQADAEKLFGLFFMKVLIVDDEVNIRSTMSKFFAIEDIDSDGAENGFSAQRMLAENPYDAVLVDLRMPGMDGLSLIRWIRSEGFRMPVIMISAHGDIADAVSALKEGAQDYIVKPFDPEELCIKIKSLVESSTLRSIVENAKATEEEQSSFVGESSQIVHIREVVKKIAPSNVTVLITGESGTGKEVVAREIHSFSSVSSGPFVAINIGGVPENLLESELFGYEKGAFTGASQRKTGMFELAGGGTLFLDEIGDMPLPLQVKILRVLQDRKITRLGGTTPMPINARIIAATNKDLEQMVREGTFREDLFYRLNVVRIEIPPLRERSDDIPLLAASIISRYNRSMGTKITGFTPEALEMLKKHEFYGNVRELENVLERSMIFAEGSIIKVEDLDLRGSIQRAGGARKIHTSDHENAVTLKDIEKSAIIRSLQRWEGNRTHAAEELGISRRTLISKIAEYDIEL